MPDPPALASLVRTDCGAISGTVVAGQRPATWLAGLVRSGALEARLGTGLAAALIQHPEPATVCEGARLAVELQVQVIGPVLVRALGAHDTALLLQVDPGQPGSSVEDTLVRAASVLVDLTEPALRAPLLEYLRNAGLPALEVPILIEHGDAEELHTWLPAVLAEGLADEVLPVVARRLARGDAGAEVLRAALAPEVVAALESAS